MVGKNNKKEQLRKNATKNTRFSLKKLSVGVASVAVGASLLVGNVAHAEEAALKQDSNKSNSYCSSLLMVFLNKQRHLRVHKKNLWSSNTLKLLQDIQMLNFHVLGKITN
ncbi:hypothetical protein BWX42_06050 [Dolosigranulum pigrum]|uniref:YSIRK Gram-positive signal peptide domain-containing protein n=1 Tax=Dolosigranulum pigrum TaxID=29394 RepID=A0A1S8KNM0_9LACT|nr:hypothetical protein BWX42_06050 [Dolosigranulum pigrum]